MSAIGFDMKDISKAQPRYPAISRAILFIIPSIVVTVVSIVLFSRLTGLSATQITQNHAHQQPTHRNWELCE